MVAYLRNSRFSTVDNRTGELIPSVTVVPQAKESDMFIKMFDYGLELLCDDDRLKLTDIRVFLRMCRMMEDGNWFRESLADLASSINCNPASVSKSVKKLVNCGYIYKAVKKGVIQTYIIDPAICFQGYPDDRERIDSFVREQRIAQREFEEQELKELERRINKPTKGYRKGGLRRDLLSAISGGKTS